MQFPRDPVVFPQPQRVHPRQPGLLVDPLVPRVEAVQVGRRDAALLARRGLFERGQEGLADVEVGVIQFT